jgi:hypothetical protein
LAERTEAKVALASTNVPPPVVNAEIITQSVIVTSYGPITRRLAGTRQQLVCAFFRYGVASP